VADRPNPLRQMSPAAVGLGVVALGSLAWMALVAAHDPEGVWGQSAAAWAQAIMSVGAIVAAIVIDRGASRRARQEQREASAREKTVRVGSLVACAGMLETAARAVLTRELGPKATTGGGAVRAVVAGQRMINHYVAHAHDDDPVLVWVLNRAADELDTAVDELMTRKLATEADRLDLSEATRNHARELRELVDEYEAGIFHALSERTPPPPL